MLFICYSLFWMNVFVTISQASAISFNQPKFCPDASWDPNGITFANSNTVGPSPFHIFIDSNNTIYMTDQSNNYVQVWLEGDVNPTRTISGNLYAPCTVFVTMNGDVYIANENNSRVVKWTLTATSSITVMNVTGRCYGLFVDINNNLYCSIDFNHQVVKMSLNDGATTPTVIAGTGSAGAEPYMLNYPNGIFVDINFNVYVADWGNNRIQLFKSGQLNATTVAIGTITLNGPTDIILDGDGYLFIVDRSNQRIIGQRPDGFQCLVGCSNSIGSTASELSWPHSFAFDSYGNLFVLDNGNSRIQQFVLVHNSCDQYTTNQEIETSSVQLIDLTTSVTKITTIITASESWNDDTTIFPLTTTIEPLAPYFIAPTCSDPNHIGLDCSITIAPCDVLHPCQNNGSCRNDNSTLYGYVCSCPIGFNGTECQFDNRPCKPTTCWNNGTCMEVFNTSFSCSCAPGWEGIHCERMVNFCQNVTCLNKGLCRPLLLDYKCECLGDGYSGRHCEKTASNLVVHQTVSRSCGFIAIGALLGLIIFIVALDVLKYGFRVDPVGDELVRVHRKRVQQQQKRRRRPAIQRITYVNPPSSSDQTNSTIQESTV